MAKRSVAVKIAGQEYKLRSDAEEGWLQGVAAQVDTTMKQIRERTGTVDSYDVAVLTALNLAREVILLRAARDQAREGQVPSIDPERMRSLIERVEAAAAPPRASAG